MLTVQPYAIANGLPFSLIADFELLAQNAPVPATVAAAAFFNGGKYSNHKVLLAWEHDHIPTTVNALINSYFRNGPPPTDKVAPNWPDPDYDAVWSVTLDAIGNLTVDNSICEGINSGALPVLPPIF
jgi:hypothetical protein